jgi:hypothetical protein
MFPTSILLIQLLKNKYRCVWTKFVSKIIERQKFLLNIIKYNRISMYLLNCKRKSQYLNFDQE